MFEGLGVWEMVLRSRFAFAWVVERYHACEFWITCTGANRNRKSREVSEKGVSALAPFLYLR
jgi:hypothetical protein